MALLPILTRCLGPELFGLWGKLYALAGLIAGFIDLGATGGMHRFLPSAREDERGKWFGTALALVLAVGAALVVVLFVAAPGLGPLLSASGHSPGRPVITALGGLAAVIALSQLVTSYFRFTTRAKIYGSLILGQFVLLISIALTGWWVIGSSLWTPLAAWGLALASIALWGLALVVRETPLRVQASAGAEMIRFGAPLLPGVLLLWLAHFADRFMLGWLLPTGGDAGVGVYVANYSLGGLVSFIFGPFMLFVRPTATRLWDSGQVAETARFIRQTGKFALVLACPVIIAVSFVGGDLVALVAGRDFVARWPVMLLVMTGYLMLYLGYLTEIPLMMARRTTRLMGHNFIAAALNLALNLILIPLSGPWGGLTGAALATAVGFAAYPVLNLIADRVYGQSFFNFTAGARCLIAALAGVAVIRLIGVQTPPRLILALAASAPVYAGLLVALKVITPLEISTLAREAAGMLKIRRS